MVISGDDVFKLYDTFGFPIDLTREIAEEAGLSIDNDRFTALMQEQKTRARAARGNIGGWSDSSKDLLADLPKTEFVGYGNYDAEAKVIALIVDDMLVDEVSEGDVTVILDKTPCYGEGGGQIGDTGAITDGTNGLRINDTQKSDGVYIHLAKIQRGTIKVGDSVKVIVDTFHRQNIMRNHSAAHLLQAALRKVLGDHVEQAGSYVSDKICRFDFSHFQALTAKEIADVEAHVNQQIMFASPIITKETDIETAKKEGAMALFGEKYGNTVRMVKMGNFSTELCGGTHCANTSEVALFKIVSESSVAAGVRRIEAITGLNVLDLINQKDALINETARELKVQNPADVAKKASATVAELAAAKREIESLNSKLAATKLDSLLSGAKAVGSVNLCTARFDGMAIEVARSLADEIKASRSDVVAVLAVASEGKLNFITVCGADAVKAGAHAGKIVSAVAAVTGGKGGGRPDNAMAGGRDVSLIADALAAAETTLAGMLK